MGWMGAGCWVLGAGCGIFRIQFQASGRYEVVQSKDEMNAGSYSIDMAMQKT